MALRNTIVDISPLKQSRDFRLLYIGRSCSMLMVGIKSVAINVQVYELTGSSLSVGAVNLALAVPMTLALLAGGLLADRADRRMLMIVWRSLYIVPMAALLVNALMVEPRLAIIYGAAAVSGVVDGLSLPVLLAATPGIVPRAMLPSANALNGLAIHIGAVVGPFVAGILIAQWNVAACYAAMVVGAVLGPAVLVWVRPLPVVRPSKQSPARALVEAARFIWSSRVMRALLALDLAVAILAMPMVLFPQLASGRLDGGPETVGYLFSALAAGGLATSLTSGWARRCMRPGLVIAASVVVRGLAIVGLGLATNVEGALACLFVAGASMTATILLRVTLIQNLTPDALRGRVSGLWLMQNTAAIGVGAILAGLGAQVYGAHLVAIVGGVACVAVTALVIGFMPALVKVGACIEPHANEDGSSGLSERNA